MQDNKHREQIQALINDLVILISVFALCMHASYACKSRAHSFHKIMIPCLRRQHEIVVRKAPSQAQV